MVSLLYQVKTAVELLDEIRRTELNQDLSREDAEKDVFVRKSNLVRVLDGKRIDEIISNENISTLLNDDKKHKDCFILFWDLIHKVHIEKQARVQGVDDLPKCIQEPLLDKLKKEFENSVKKLENCKNPDDESSHLDHINKSLIVEPSLFDHLPGSLEIIKAKLSKKIEDNDWQNVESFPEKAQASLFNKFINNLNSLIEQKISFTENNQDIRRIKLLLSKNPKLLNPEFLKENERVFSHDLIQTILPVAHKYKMAIERAQKILNHKDYDGFFRHIRDIRDVDKREKITNALIDCFKTEGKLQGDIIDKKSPLYKALNTHTNKNIVVRSIQSKLGMDTTSIKKLNAIKLRESPNSPKRESRNTMKPGS